MDTRVKLKHVELNENIVFWKWVNNNKLAIVTNQCVYHLNIQNANE